MVTLVVGFPGSGKSFYAVDKIFNILSLTDKMSENIDIIYTNINGVKFDYFPDSKIEFKKFNDSEFYVYLIELYTLYEINKNDDSVDDKLIELSKEKGYHNALIVFDECHDFFSSQDKYKIFWLTYHRHLYHEIILLTQNKTLINSKYRAIPEIFVEAQPRSKKIMNNSLSYKKYASFAMSKKDLFGKDVLKARQEVFNLYQSGNKSNQKSILSKYIKLIVLFVIIVFCAFYYILNSFTNAPAVEETKKTIVKRPTQKINISNISNNTPFQLSNNLVIKLMCDNKRGCTFENNIYPILYVKSFIKRTKSETLFKDFFFRNTIINHKIYFHYIYTTKKSLSSFFVVDTNKQEVKKLNTDFNINKITDKVTL